MPRERIVILSALGVIVLLSWVYLFDMARAMDVTGSGGHCASVAGEPWSLGYFSAMLVMWLIGWHDGALRNSDGAYLRLHRPKGGSRRESMAATEIFVAGYVIIWSLFALVATIAQWALDRMALLSPMMMSNSNIFGGLL